VTHPDLRRAAPSRSDPQRFRLPAGSRLFAYWTLASWGLLLVQSWILLPLVQRDPLFAELPEAVSLQHTYWTLRLVALAVVPCVLAARVLTLAVVLHTFLGPRVPDALRATRHALLEAEGVFLLESACTTLLLLLGGAEDLDAAASLHLRAGIDLLWQPESATLAAWVTAANVFVFWWMEHVRAALVRIYGLRRRVSWVVAGLLAAAIVAGRALFLPA